MPISPPRSFDPRIDSHPVATRPDQEGESGRPPDGARQRAKGPGDVLAGTGPAWAFVVILGVFWPTVSTFPRTWSAYGMTHGWVIAGLVLWVLWRDRALFRSGRTAASPFLVPLTVLSLLWLAVTVAHIQLFQQLLFVLVLVAWGLTAFAARAARTVLALGATLLAAVPIWDVFLPVLRIPTTLASGAMVKLMGIPAVIEGDLIHIPAGTFLVEDGCAGLNTLIAGVVVGVAYAHLLVRRWRAQLMVVALAAAIAIVGNWIRVAALIVIGHATDMQSGMMEDHIWFGWVIFTIGLVPFFYLAGILERRSGSPTPRPSESEDGAPARNGEALERPRPMLTSVGLATLVAVTGPALYFGIGALPASSVEERVLADFARGDVWQSVEGDAASSDSWKPQYQRATEEETIRFTDGEAFVHGHRFAYMEQAVGAKLIGIPNRIADGRDILDARVVGPASPDGRRWVRQAVVATPDGPILVWYWFRVGGVETFSPIHAKALEVPAFLARRRLAELLAFSTPCTPDDCSAALRTMTRFMGVPGAYDAPPGSTGAAVPITPSP